MDGNTQIKYPFILRTLSSLMLMLLIVACDKQDSDTQNSASVKSSTANFNKTYERRGLTVKYPEDWLLVTDDQEISLGSGTEGLFEADADRRILFDTPEASSIYILFYKTKPLTLLDSSKSLVNELSLENSEYIKDLKREKVNIGNYEGLKLSWLTKGIISLTGEFWKEELTIIKLRDEPYPVHVQFYLGDTDISNLNSAIIPFLEGISFDLQAIEL